MQIHDMLTLKAWAASNPGKYVRLVDKRNPTQDSGTHCAACVIRSNHYVHLLEVGYYMRTLGQGGKLLHCTMRGHVD